MKLKNWCFFGADIEKKTFRLVGQVYGHDRFENGELIRTSKIISFNIETMIAHSESGSSYELGAMSQDLVDWMKKHGKRLKDFHNP